MCDIFISLVSIFGTRARTIKTSLEVARLL